MGLVALGGSRPPVTCSVQEGFAVWWELDWTTSEVPVLRLYSRGTEHTTQLFLGDISVLCD